MSTVSKLVVSKAVRFVNLPDLNIDRSYQRDEYKKLIGKIAATFDPDALGLPLVAEREDGSLWVVDGQQRCAALRLLGKPHLRAQVFASQGPEHEAMIFQLVNFNRKKLTAGEEFGARLTAGDADAWALKAVADEYGFKMNTTGKVHLKNRHGNPTKELSCVNTLVRMTKVRGVECVGFVLGVVRDCWFEDPQARSSHIVEALAQLWTAHGGAIDTDRLYPRLRTTTPTKITFSASLGVSNRASNAYHIIEKLYAKRMPSIK